MRAARSAMVSEAGFELISRLDRSASAATASTFTRYLGWRGFGSMLRSRGVITPTLDHGPTRSSPDADFPCCGRRREPATPWKLPRPGLNPFGQRGLHFLVHHLPDGALENRRQAVPVREPDGAAGEAGGSASRPSRLHPCIGDDGVHDDRDGGDEPLHALHHRRHHDVLRLLLANSAAASTTIPSWMTCTTRAPIGLSLGSRSASVAFSPSASVPWTGDARNSLKGGRPLALGSRRNLPLAVLDPGKAPTLAGYAGVPGANAGEPGEKAIPEALRLGEGDRHAVRVLRVVDEGGRAHAEGQPKVDRLRELALPGSPAPWPCRERVKP